MVFVLITLLGVTYVGARYARLDRLVFDDAYTVVAHFPDSGGIFAGAEVSYRGVKVGQVEKMELTDRGVDVYLDVDNDYDKIPADVIAVVGNRSAVGEQYVEIQPQVDTSPYLSEASEIDEEDTRIPIATEKLLDRHLEHRRVGRQAGPRDQRHRARRGVRRHRPGPAADHRHGQLVHRGRERQLRRHHRADPGQQHRPARPDRLDERDQAVRPGPVAVQRHPGRLRRGPARGHRQRLGHRQPAPHVPRGQRGRPRRAGEQPDHHRRGRRQAPRRGRPDPGDLPLRGRGRLHRRLQVPGQRAVRRPLRHDPDPGAEGLRARLRGHRRPRRRRTAATSR